MKKISTAATQKIGKIEGQRLKIDHDGATRSFGSVVLLLPRWEGSRHGNPVS
jgi:hypothetical protein